MIQDRLWGAAHAFDHPVTRWITAGVGTAIVLALAIIGALSAAGVVKEPLRSELWKRTFATA